MFHSSPWREAHRAEHTWRSGFHHSPDCARWDSLGTGGTRRRSRSRQRIRFRSAGASTLRSASASGGSKIRARLDSSRRRNDASPCATRFCSAIPAAGSHIAQRGSSVPSGWRNAVARCAVDRADANASSVAALSSGRSTATSNHVASGSASQADSSPPAGPQSGRRSTIVGRDPYSLNPCCSRPMDTRTEAQYACRSRDSHTTCALPR